ncbi:MAG: hypothetical protein Q9195_007181 [Heterodermia aff. obscurata]
MSKEQDSMSADGPNYSNLGGIVQLGLLAPPSQNRSKREAKKRVQQVAWDPVNSVKIASEWKRRIPLLLARHTLKSLSAPGNGTLAENFRRILEQLPGAPSTLTLTRAWLSYNEATGLVERNNHSITQHAVIQSNNETNMGSILSALCRVEDLGSKSSRPQTRQARSISSSQFVQVSNVQEPERGIHPSIVNARTDSDASSAIVNSGPSGSRVPRRRVRNRSNAVLNRYSRAHKHPDISNMIQQHHEEDRRAGKEFNRIMRMKQQSRDKKWDRYKRYREGTLGMQPSTFREDRISKNQSRKHFQKHPQKHPQQVKPNEKHTNLKKWKKQLDGLFAEAGYQ